VEGHKEIEEGMKAKDHHRAFIHEELVKFCDQLGIGDDIPQLVFTTREVLDMPKHLTEGRRVSAYKYRGVCYTQAKTLFINLRNHKTINGARTTLVHELVHYRFQYMRHGKAFEKRIRNILAGKRYPKR
jgi:hypothetical protein